MFNFKHKNNRTSTFINLCIYIYVPLGTDLTKLLERLSLDKYITIFEENSVDLSEFLKMTEDDLKNVGIRYVIMRNRLIDNN